MSQTEATEFRLPGPGRRPARVDDEPAMRLYCTTLSRFASSISTTALTLADVDATDREDGERKRRDQTSRLHTVDAASTEAAAAMEEAGAAREAYGIARVGETPSGSIGFGAATADLAPEMAAVARGREELRQATETVDQWVTRHDAQTGKVMRAATILAAVAFAGALVVVGGREVSDTWSPLGLVMLTVGAVVSAAAGIAVGVVRRAPEITTGPPLARRPDVAAIIRHGGIIASYAAIALLVSRIGSTLIL